MRPFEILHQVRQKTPQIILFHSLAGKDSIYLLDLCSQIFEHIHCVYMYYIPDLVHMQKYRDFFTRQYDNISFYETEHFATISYKKYGFYGYKAEPKRKKLNLAMIMDFYRDALNIDWVCLGSKQSDALSRRLQLRTYDFEAIDWKKNKVYPLSKLKNKEVYQYIKINNLIEPLNYGDNKQSQSNDITDGNFLAWCKKFYPGDYQKIISIFPDCEIILFRYENRNNK